MNKKELIANYERVSKFSETVKTKSVIDKLKQLDEPKVQVPQFVADWIEKCKSEKSNCMKRLLTRRLKSMAGYLFQKIKKPSLVLGLTDTKSRKKSGIM